MSYALDPAPPLSTKCKAVASKVLYVSEYSPWGKLGYETVATAFSSVLPIYWSPGMPKPDLSDWHGDWIISFKSDLILSRALLRRAKNGAINFHPSPTKYRGVGGYWWALHNGDDVFGVTCHHMNERIDDGPIITTKTFPIWPEETVESLRHRAAIHSLGLLNEMLNTILSGNPLPCCGAKWENHLYTYEELALAKSMRPTESGWSLASALGALEAVTKSDIPASIEQGEKRVRSLCR